MVALACLLNWVTGILLGWVTRDTLQKWRDAKKRWARSEKQR